VSCMHFPFFSCLVLSSISSSFLFHFFFFFNDTATTEIYTLSLHDALPISRWNLMMSVGLPLVVDDLLFNCAVTLYRGRPVAVTRSEEHTSELQSLAYLVCRLLLEKKKNSNICISMLM